MGITSCFYPQAQDVGPLLPSPTPRRSTTELPYVIGETNLLVLACNQRSLAATGCHGRWRPRAQQLSSHPGMLNARPAARRPAAAAAATVSADAAELDMASDSDGGGQIGPAASATLGMLDWPRLCQDVASFASTTLGREGVLHLRVPQGGREAAVLAAVTETAAADLLEGELAADLDFGGISTAQARDAILRVSKGGMLTGSQLVATASLLLGAARLQRNIASAARAASQVNGEGFRALEPLTAALQGLETHPRLVEDINASVEEDGRVKDNASEGVRRTRQRLRQAEARLTALLKSYPGEVTEVKGRLCVAVPAGDNPAMPKAILLGSAAGGSVLYLEPPSAVSHNNDMAALRGEAYAAEEAVLWALTGRAADASADLQRALDLVIWLDVLVSKARYGRWIGGTLPEMVPWPRTGKARGGSATRKARRQQQGEGGVVVGISSSSSSIGAGGDVEEVEEGEEEQEGEERVHEDPNLFRLRQLRHPLLLASHLRHREAKRKAAGSGGGTMSRRLSNRKDEVPEPLTSPTALADGSSGNGDENSVLEKGPVPLDVCVPPATRAVVITGPNTGGKTATLKAFGLAVLMAQCGIPIPAQPPVRLPPVSAVLADIGDEQSLSASLSTFSGHLRRIQALRYESDGRSVVLLDEVGTGTDPHEGSALGVALMQALVRGGPGGAGLVVATTHHSALTALKYEDERFENASVEFDEEALRPTYRLLWGVPGRSNALNIAQRLGLDPGIVGRARDSLGIAQAEVDSGIIQLEDARRRYEADESAAMALTRRLADTQEQVARQRQRVLQQRASLQLRHGEVVSAAVRAARDRAQRLARRRQQQGKAEQQQRVAQEQQQAAEEKKEQSREWVPRVGDMVFVPRLKGSAKVVAVDSSGVMTLQMGLLKIKATKDEVQASA